MHKALTLTEAVTNGVGIERPCLCPVHDDTRPSASVNVLKGVWYCYTCKATGKVDGEVLAGEIDFRMVREYIEELFVEPKIYPESWLNQFDAGGPGDYWLSRFSPEACAHFRLGEDHDGRPTYPFRDERGQVLGVVTRSGLDRGPKYLYPKGLDVGMHLFGYSFESQPVLFLVEGAADAIAVWEAGYPAFAIYGSRLSDRQTELITVAQPSLIVTAFDQDDPGRYAAQQVAKAFPGSVVGDWYEQLGDVADMNLSLRKKILQRLVSDRRSRVGSDSCGSQPPKILSPGMRQPSLPLPRLNRS